MPSMGDTRTDTGVGLLRELVALEGTYARRRFTPGTGRHLLDDDRRVRRCVLPEDLGECPNVRVREDAHIVEMSLVVSSFDGGDLLSEFENLAKDRQFRRGRHAFL